ncbi:Mammalian cell entry related domain-containing protein [Ectopseudomonas oleovorans]|uniref:Mammalian cell entry related domain-containing protein n=1 Tax=Ectopseudomonas oleovorans TaxID=301 RepID=A0A379K2W7_ECTOL|nr:MlaD family protein [Pseudomonas oleovorans]SUD59010.1 Mammalian cell entry related domain-containing protein [Pseudomonas oleovorans]
MTDLPLAKTRPASNWSAIWVLPLIALLIGGWLAWRAYSEAGIQVELVFASGEGIQAGKTELMFKGMAVGKVTAISLDSSGEKRGVVTQLEVNKELEQYLRSGTRFWLVKPKVSLAGISGLETLVSGNYITFSPGEGEVTRSFTALPQEPPMGDDVPGLHITLEGSDFWVVKPSISLAGITGLEALVKGNYIAVRPGDKGNPPARSFVARSKAPPLDLGAPGLHLVLFSDQLGSIEVGSPVLYRQIKVGSVQSYQLGRDNSQVVLGVHIEPDYVHLVNTSTRFWNASGITLKGGLSGVEVKSESLQTLLAGGIAFDTLDLQAARSDRQVQRFALHADRDSALQLGQQITIRLADGDGLQPGTLVRYKGLEVGKVENLSLTDDLQAVILNVRITQAAEQIAREGTRFWVVKPELSLIRAANLGTLVSGQYLEVQPSAHKGARRTEFTALASAPNQAVREEGLRLVLSAPRRGSIKPGVLVSYREVPVGKVVDFELGPTSDRVLIHVLIEPRYAPLVRSGSRFWNASGIGVDAGLFKGVKVRTESLEALLEGGIAFATPNNPEMGGPAQPGQTFALFDEPQDAWMQWAPKIVLD